MSTKILQKLTFQKNFVNLTCVRWKGHSKWQNIQHTKAEKDGQRSKLAWTYNRKIGVAIRENGNETDPDRNRSLARVLKEAIAQGVMQSTIDKAIKGFKSSNDVEGLFELRGPGRTGLIVEMIGSNEGNMRTILNTITKKHQAAIEIGVKNMFERKGIIICAKSISLEQAEELAIEFGAEEVEEEDEILNFYTSPLDFPEVTEKLQKQLEIIEQQVEYVPNLHVELSKRDKALLYSLLDALKSNANVLAVHHNATW